MSSANILFAVICWVSTLPFVAIAIWAFKRKEPMHFWSGSTVSPEEITNIPAYNRANGLMWTVYAIGYLITGLLSLVNIIISVVLLILVSVVGTVALIVFYNRIYKKYKNPAYTFKPEHVKAKTPKGIIIAIVAFMGIVFVLVGVLFYYGSKDAIVNVQKDSIQIKAMYGLTIDRSEISAISLIEESMDDIGVGTRINGYGGFDGVLKGTFESEALGNVLLFVHEKSSPTIKIERKDKKNIYISLRNSEKTEQLYKEIKTTIPLE